MSERFGIDPDYVPGPALSRRIVRRVALIIALIVAGNLLVIIMARWLDPQTSGPFGSSFVTTEEGVGAWHDLLSELGRSTERSRAPLTEVVLPTDTTVVLVDPTEGLDAAYASALLDHAESGGRVVLVGVANVARLFDLDLDLTRTVQDDAPVPGGLTGGVGAVDARSDARYALGDLEAVVGDARSALVARAVRGDGDVIVVADPWLFSNADIGLADNAVLAVRLTGSADVVFDEYVHGFGLDQGVSGLAESVVTFVVVGVIAALLGMWAVGKRLGPPEQQQRALPPPRSEYLEAVGRSLEHAGDDDAYDVLRTRALRHVHRIGNRYVGLSRAEQQRKAALQLGLTEADMALLEIAPRGRDAIGRVARVAAEIESTTERTRRWTSSDAD